MNFNPFYIHYFLEQYDGDQLKVLMTLWGKYHRLFKKCDSVDLNINDTGLTPYKFRAAIDGLVASGTVNILSTPAGKRHHYTINIVTERFTEFYEGMAKKKKSKIN